MEQQWIGCKKSGAAFRQKQPWRSGGISLAWNCMFGHKAKEVKDHSGLTWTTFTREESTALEVTLNCWKLSLVMMKTMEEELKVTLFLGRFLESQALETTMGRMGRSAGVSGRSLRFCCSQEILWKSREQSSCRK
ncbi:hypothetical protein CCH79_00001366 [Gambusia affinis]|uniref:Uncharacterized protein n=1 Tax=Gambusia affinis TaxID=33528 RepID=A0A315VSD9_GAMAF|nr:hypothetical protein CCH79_00001366 [Gambusia affinis]